jgi:hypothetical protein
MSQEVSVDGYEVATLHLGGSEVAVVRPVNRTWWEGGLHEKPLQERWNAGLTRRVKHRELDKMKQNLHRVFATRAVTPEGVCEFAGKYGLLGIEDISRQTLQDAGYSPWDTAELLSNWYGYANLVRQVLSAYQTDGLVNGVAPAAIVNNLFRQYPSLPVLKKPEEYGSHVLDLEPTSLMAAIVLHLARELAEMTVRKVCRGCGKPFWLKEGQRSDTAYCSKQCKTRSKVRAYRRRKATSQNARKCP